MPNKKTGFDNKTYQQQKKAGMRKAVTAPDLVKKVAKAVAKQMPGQASRVKSSAKKAAPKPPKMKRM